MQRVKVAGAALIAAVVSLPLLPLPSQADAPRNSTGVLCFADGTCIDTVGTSASSGPAKKGSGGTPVTAAKKGPALNGGCTTDPIVPQPPLSDPDWGGHTTGTLYWVNCNFNGQNLPGTAGVTWKPAATPAATPAQAAQRAVALLRLPKPVGYRSPTEHNNDRGRPFTWVHLWTWYWTSPLVWKDEAKTARLPGVAATVTATPVQLIFEPGDGAAAVTCAGPGRAWGESDGSAAPSDGGCGYMYRHVSDGVRARMSIRWRVSWTGTGAAGGQLPDMTSTSLSPVFRVEQAQTVTVPR